MSSFSLPWCLLSSFSSFVLGLPIRSAACTVRWLLLLARAVHSGASSSSIESIVLESVARVCSFGFLGVNLSSTSVIPGGFFFSFRHGGLGEIVEIELIKFHLVSFLHGAPF